MEKEVIKKILRKDSHQKVLDYIVKASGYQTGSLNKAGVISSVSQEVFSGREDRLARTTSVFELFYIHDLLELNGREVKITEKTLEYAKK